MRYKSGCGPVPGTSRTENYVRLQAPLSPRGALRMAWGQSGLPFLHCSELSLFTLFRVVALFRLPKSVSNHVCLKSI